MLLVVDGEDTEDNVVGVGFIVRFDDWASSDDWAGCGDWASCHGCGDLLFKIASAFLLEAF